jgi:hypothetical protein
LENSSTKTQFFEKFSNLKRIQVNEHTIMVLLAVTVGVAAGFVVFGI